MYRSTVDQNYRFSFVPSPFPSQNQFHCSKSRKITRKWFSCNLRGSRVKWQIPGTSPRVGPTEIVSNWTVEKSPRSATWHWYPLNCKKIHFLTTINKNGFFKIIFPQFLLRIWIFRWSFYLFPCKIPLLNRNAQNNHTEEFLNLFFGRI